MTLHTQPVLGRRRREADRRRRISADRGSVTLEFAVLFPVILLLIIGIIQVLMWYFAKEIALAAAREGAEAGRLYQGGGCADAQMRAEDSARNLGGGLLQNLGVTSTCANPTEVRVDVTATSVSILPGVTIKVHQYAVVAKERWTG